MKLAHAVLVIGLVAAGPARAQDLTLKPGLWQITLTQQVIDGRDILAERAAKLIKMKDAATRLPPERQREMEQQLGGVTRLCVGAGAIGGRGAGESMPGMGGCNPEKLVQSGTTISYQFNCEARGLKISGQGERTTFPTGLHTRSDTTTVGPSGRHIAFVESDLVYLGADCQGLAAR